MYESDRERDRSEIPVSIAWISRHPMLLWGGLWTVALSVTVGVTVGLLHGQLFSPRGSLDNSFDTSSDISSTLPNNSLRGEEIQRRNTRELEDWREPQEQLESSPPQDSSSISNPKPVFPIWLIGAIILGCSVGSLFVTLILKSLSLSQNTAKQLHPPQKLSSTITPRFQAQFGATPHYSPIIADRQPLITVLPPEAIAPLDSPERDGNLLEQLDLRKRHSLSSLMEYTDDDE